MKYFLTILFAVLFFLSAYPQNELKFCKAVEKDNFRKVERIFKREVNKIKSGFQYDNGPGSGIQTTHQYTFDTLTAWLKNMPCIEDAYWDKCEIKIAIYPGWTNIGAKFKSPSGVKEKCFSIQMGTTGTVNIFGWKPKLCKEKNSLVYKKMFDNAGFIDRQKQNCAELIKKK